MNRRDRGMKDSKLSVGSSSKRCCGSWLIVYFYFNYKNDLNKSNNQEYFSNIRFFKYYDTLNWSNLFIPHVSYKRVELQQEMLVIIGIQIYASG
jgi:hypothetical protein